MGKTVVPKRIEKRCSACADMLAEVDTAPLLDELYRRGYRIAEDLDTIDLLEVLSQRRGVDVTLVEDYDIINLKVAGPAVVTTVFL